MTDRRARLAATRSPAFMAGYRAFTPGAVHPSWQPNSPQDEQYIRGWEAASDDYEFDSEDRQPIHRRLSPMSAFERNRP